MNELFETAWQNHNWTNFQPILKQSLGYVCAFEGEKLVGFVNLAWDGGVHAFLLDTTVHSHWQKRGIGLKLVKQAAKFAKESGLLWVHVDYEPPLESFYQQAGFRPTLAGLINLTD